MGRHAAPRHRLLGLGSVQVRLLLCLGVFAIPAGVGTMAYWTDTATIQGGTIESGTLDLTVGASVEDSGHLPGEGGTFEYSQLTIGNLIPGESIARPFVVRNSGSVGFTYNATVATENNELVSGADGLMVEVYVDATADNNGTEADGNRSGSCTGGSLVRSQAVSTSTSSVDLHTIDQNLAADATRTYCARVVLPAAAPNALQGRATSLIIALDAQQQGAP